MNLKLLSLPFCLFASLSYSAFATVESGPTITMVKQQYVGDGQVEIQLSLSNAAEVKKVVLSSLPKNDPHYPELPEIILTKNNPVASIVIKTNRNPTVVNDNSVLEYDNNIALYNNDDIKKISTFYKPLYLKPLDVSGEGIISIEHNFLREQNGIDNNGLVKNLKTKTITNEMRFHVNASALKEFNAVIFSNGEEFLSDNEQDLANAINSKRVEYEINLRQKVKTVSKLCLPTGQCAYNRSTPIKDRYEQNDNYNSLPPFMKLIKKGEIESVVWVPIDYRFEIEKASNSK